MNPEFFTWLEEHHSNRSKRQLEDLVQDAGSPEAVAIVAVDLVEGFCSQGALASPLIATLVEPSKSFLSEAYNCGIRNFFFPCDSHLPDCPEFSSFPPHCVANTEESKIVSSLLELEFSNEFERFDKRSVSSLLGTKLLERLREIEPRTLVCIGDCTDLCLYHLATGLRFYANQWNLPWKIVVPENLVATYDLPVAKANEIGALPHPAELMHKLFLYHMELSGVEICQLSHSGLEG